MKTKISKAIVVLLAMMLLVISSSVVAGAADTVLVNEFSNKWQLVADKPTVTLNGTDSQTVTVSLMTKEALDCYGIEGTWDISEKDGVGYIRLTDLAFNQTLPVNEYRDFAYAITGEVQWANDTFDMIEMLEGYTIMTATYTVDANTPAGTYVVRFIKDVYTGADGEPTENQEELAVNITVTHHECTHDTYGYDENNHWSICACGKVVEGSTNEHVFVNGSCVCGAEEKVTNITVVSKGVGKYDSTTDSGYSVNGNVVTVKYALACKVGYLVDGSYVAITPVANNNGSYSFTAPAGVTEVLLVVKGDVTGEGSILTNDVSRLNAYVLGKTPLTAEAQFAADVTGEGSILTNDVSRLNAYVLGKATLAW